MVNSVAWANRDSPAMPRANWLDSGAIFCIIAVGIGVVNSQQPAPTSKQCPWHGLLLPINRFISQVLGPSGVFASHFKGVEAFRCPRAAVVSHSAHKGMVGTQSTNKKAGSTTTPMTKEKAKPTKSLKCPDIQRGKEGKEGGDSSAASSTSIKRPGLDRFVQKALVKTLKGKGGGVGNHQEGTEPALSKPLDKMKAVLGKKGDPIRGQLSKCCTRWVDHHKAGTHSNMVPNRFNVESAAT